MVGNDNVTFRFVIDDRQFIVKGKRMGAVLQEIQRKAVGASGSVQQFGNTVQRSGQQSAASAINFQTGMQGMLNLSTAAVQTFTSISNLDRANNRAKQSIIAVARAEDLLNNKKQRANEMQNAGVVSGGKYANILREIATAEADLVVKTEKKKIEQAAVNDIYMLFATNIANVTISSMQTIALLDKNQILLTKAKIVVQKISNASMFVGAKAAFAQSAAMTLQTKVTAGATAATLGLTGSVIALGAATRAFMASNPILLVAMIASTAAFAAYELNVGGVKDRINELMGVEESFEDQVNASRDAVDDMTGSLSSQEDQLFKMPNTYSGIINKLAELRDHYDGVTRAANNNTTAIIHNQSVSPVIGGGGRRSFSSGDGSSQIRTQGNLLPFADASVAPYWADPGFKDPRDVIINGRPADDYRNRQDTGSFKVESILDPNIKGGFQLDSPILGFSRTALGATVPAGIIGKQKAFEIVGLMRREAIRELAQEMGISNDEATLQVDSNTDWQAIGETLLITAATPQAFQEQDMIRGLKRFIPKTYVDFKKDAEFKKLLDDVKVKAKVDIQFKATRAGLSVKDYVKRRMISNITRIKAGGGRLNADELAFLKKSNTIIGGVGGEELFAPGKVRIARSMRRNEEAGRFLPDETQFDKLISATFGRSIILSKDDPLLKDTSGFSASRKAAWKATGFDLGAIADKITPAEAINLASIRKSMRQVSNQIGGNASGAIFLAGLNTAAENNLNIQTPAWIIQELKIKDANSNRLRYGGTRQLDESGFALPLTVSGAVTGGFTSLRSYLRDRRNQLWKSSTLAVIELANFGITTKFSHRRVTANAQRNRVIQQAAAISSSLQAAGLSGGMSYAKIRKVNVTAYMYSQFQARQAAARNANNELLARASSINLLMGGFGLDSFFGSGLSSISLQDEIARQDDLIKSIGLNRTDAFRIIDAEGRGRTEIDDRVKWTQRNESISTGVAVI